MRPEDLKAYMQEVCKERGLSMDVVRDVIEQALLQAMKKALIQYINPKISVDPDTGELSLWVVKTVVPRISANLNTEISLREANKIYPEAREGDEVVVLVKGAKIDGRNVASQAYQFIQTRLREAGRDKVNHEYAKRIGEIVVATVDRHEHDYVVLRLPDKTEAMLHKKQMIGPPRSLRIKDSVKVMIYKIEPENIRMPIVQTTRTSERFVEQLFAQEVPEIADGTVSIVAIAREAGLRTKIAVRSNKPDIDPVGACVGQKGSRVQQVVRELETEKVDVIAWTDDPAALITAAIDSGSPEKVVVGVKIVSKPDNGRPGRALVTVKKDHVAVALGKKGVNVDLSNILSGYRIEILREGEELKRDVAEVKRDYLNDFLSQIVSEWGVSEEIAANIYNSSNNSVEALSNATPASLLPLVQGDRKLATEIIAAAKGYFEQARKQTRHIQNHNNEPESGDSTEG